MGPVPPTPDSWSLLTVKSVLQPRVALKVVDTFSFPCSSEGKKNKNKNKNKKEQKVTIDLLPGPQRPISDLIMDP
jgi:hypothetical protein